MKTTIWKTTITDKVEQRIQDGKPVKAYLVDEIEKSDEAIYPYSTTDPIGDEYKHTFTLDVDLGQIELRSDMERLCKEVEDMDISYDYDPYKDYEDDTTYSVFVRGGKQHLHAGSIMNDLKYKARRLKTIREKLWELHDLGVKFNHHPTQKLIKDKRKLAFDKLESFPIERRRLLDEVIKEAEEKEKEERENAPYLFWNINQELSNGRYYHVGVSNRANNISTIRNFIAPYMWIEARSLDEAFEIHEELEEDCRSNKHGTYSGVGSGSTQEEAEAKPSGSKISKPFATGSRCCAILYKCGRFRQWKGTNSFGTDLEELKEKIKQI